MNVFLIISIVVALVAAAFFGRTAIRSLSKWRTSRRLAERERQIQKWNMGELHGTKQR